MTDLYWLPEARDFRQKLSELGDSMGVGDPDGFWSSATQVARRRLDFVQTMKLDRLVQRVSVAPPAHFARVRLAILSSSTASHLIPGIRIGALRRNIHCEVYECGYGQYRQDLHQTNSGLHLFRPTCVLFSFDARHVAGGTESSEQALDAIISCWRKAQELGCSVIQQTILPVFPPLLGQNEHRLPSSPAATLSKINSALRPLADEYGVQLLSVDNAASRTGLSAWYSAALWHQSKQELTPHAGPLYGDMVGRLLGALHGKSAKCLVLDLDNTLWGGVIGDDGLGRIELGQGSATGEAYLSVQEYAKHLAGRGVILAVCSKNDEMTALLPFEKHPEMILKRGDIASFVANWQDKASNLRKIADALNIGLDTLVLVDDSPFEREQVRSELPEVTVLELPDDPALYAECIADSGCFEAINVTAEDSSRTALYQSNLNRQALREGASDIRGYLQSLGMVLRHSPFDHAGLKRITQLVNKTNQFNLSSKRYTEQDVEAFIDHPDYLTWQIRLLDRFGDNGIVAVVIARIVREARCLAVDTWLMSCRVLGRHVEHATLALLAHAARARDLQLICAEYLPTGRNEMLRDILPALGFTNPDERSSPVIWRLELKDYTQPEVFVEFAQGVHAGA